MLRTVAYFACLLALALVFWGIGLVANSGGWRGLGRLFLQFIELLDSPAKLIAIVLGLAAIVLAGCFRATQPAGFLVLGLLGVISLGRVLSLDRSSNAWLMMTPAILAVFASFWCAWTLLSASGTPSR